MNRHIVNASPRPPRRARIAAARIAGLAIALAGCAQSEDAREPAATSIAELAATPVSGVLAAGNGHTCAVVTGGIQCWGSNSGGQLGDGSTVTQTFQRVNVAGVTTGVSSLTAGASHTCVIASGAARCWGENGLGQLGNGVPGNDTTVLPDGNVPVDVTNLSSGVQALAGGNAHSCAVVGGAARCWGDNSFGQLGNGAANEVRRSPVGVSNLSSGFQAITAGGSHSCAIVNGGAWCWGLNTSGQLGNGPATADSNVPVQVTGLASGVQAIAAGLLHTCAIVGGGVVCWGSNTAGQLGIDPPGPNPIRAPVGIPALSSGVLAIAAGQSHTCALVTGGVVKCWGDNTNGQLGTGTQVPSATPVTVIGLPTGIRAITTGYQHTCAETNDHAWCWGFNGNGQLAFDPNIAPQRLDPGPIVGLVLGGCGGNLTAGTLCIPVSAPPTACASFKSCAKWENGVARVPASGRTLETTNVFGAGTRHVQQTCTGLICQTPTIRGSISQPTTCGTVAADRQAQLRTLIATSVAVEASFNSGAELSARSAQAQNVASVLNGVTVVRLNFSSVPIGPPNTTLDSWDERWACQNQVANAAPITAPNDACGCN